MKSLSNKLIIYDSNCKVCSAFRDMVVKFTSIPQTKIKAYRDLSETLSAHVDPNQFKNGMALIDTAGGRTIYGAEGVAYIFSSQHKVLAFLLSFKPLLYMFVFFYKILAYNRYVIATPNSRFNCDCFPDRVVTYRLSYILLALMISILLTALFGLSLKDFFVGVAGPEAAMQILLMAGTGWVLQILLAIIVLKNEALDYVGHLGSIMVAGLVILIPSMVITAFTNDPSPWIPVVSVMISSAYMLYLHINRIKHLELSQAWTVSWFLLLQSTALFWVYIFHLKNIL